MTRKKIISLIFVCLLLLIAIAPNILLAADKIPLNVPIGETATIDLEGNILGRYIQIWYGFIIGTVGILATVMIMWGGFKWLTSRGNSGNISEAKEIIFSALIGLVIAFLSYTILNIINPELLKIKSLNLDALNFKAVCCCNGDDCSVSSKDGKCPDGMTIQGSLDKCYGQNADYNNAYNSNGEIQSGCCLYGYETQGGYSECQDGTAKNYCLSNLSGGSWTGNTGCYSREITVEAAAGDYTRLIYNCREAE